MAYIAAIYAAQNLLLKVHAHNHIGSTAKFIQDVYGRYIEVFNRILDDINVYK